MTNWSSHPPYDKTVWMISEFTKKIKKTNSEWEYAYRTVVGWVIPKPKLINVQLTRKWDSYLLGPR